MEKKTTTGTQLVGEKIHWDILMDSVIKRDFSESLLMWHIAMDLCCISSHSEPLTSAATEQPDVSESLSEYMPYLLVMQPKIYWQRRPASGAAVLLVGHRALTATPTTETPEGRMLLGT
ncbi:hypothetical protein U9M48_004531 [Paspalum notatum var. saurae]|uniref:Uncharacterized protein n=1 Tax=Paspalum notatum var. saurae TaxID=547442 RepID=A0AAQ3PVB0_PASNO